MAKRDAGSALPLVAVVGRPNVGKSTLFNRLVGSRKALVEDSPGVTRDRHYAAFDWVGHRFRIVDTGGYDASNDTLISSIRDQTETAIAEADAIVFVVDSSEGLLASDLDAWQFLRRAQVPVFVAANKVDEGVHEARLHDFARLGVEPIYPISALHGRGVADLLDALLEQKGNERRNHGDTETLRSEEEEKGAKEKSPAGGALRPGALALKSAPLAESRIPRIAVIGKPNVGKSTLVNRLLGEERHITSDLAGTTRDAIDSTVEIAGKTYTFIDTAGIRQKARIKERVEHYSVALALKAIERADVSVLVVDASGTPSDQDAKLAGTVRDKGRALVVVLNKWDLAVKEKISKRAAVAEIARCLHFLPETPTVFVTATTGSGVDRLLPLVDSVYANYTKRVPTRDLNRTLERLVVEKPPPTIRGKLMKILYITQARAAPPTFVVATNTQEKVPDNYRRYIENRLRDALSLQGCPVRLHFRTRD